MMQKMIASEQEQLQAASCRMIHTAASLPASMLEAVDRVIRAVNRRANDALILLAYGYVLYYVFPSPE
jgi:hypothetical protein